MATFSNRFSKIRLLLALVSAVGLALGATPMAYAQDVPTPTPPVDGGDFEGAPDPTPGPEITPEPTSDEVLPDTPTENSDDITPDLPADESVTDEPNTVLQETTDDSISPEDSEDIVPETSSGELEDDTELSDDQISDDQVDPTSNEPTPDDPDTESDVAPPNNSPRGLW